MSFKAIYLSLTYVCVILYSTVLTNERTLYKKGGEIIIHIFFNSILLTSVM